VIPAVQIGLVFFVISSIRYSQDLIVEPLPDTLSRSQDFNKFLWPPADITPIPIKPQSGRT